LVVGHATAALDPPALDAVVSRGFATVVNPVGLAVKAIIPTIQLVFATV
jgi:uncharacterized membrane protein